MTGEPADRAVLMQALQAKFRARCGDEAASVDDFLSGAADEGALLATLHRIAGSAGSFGWPELSETAARLEDAVREGALVRSELEALRAELEAVSSGR